jgi:hypothetical protein
MPMQSKHRVNTIVFIAIDFVDDEKTQVATLAL